MSILYLLAFLGLFSFDTIYGQVKDAETLEPIPYAYIQFLDDAGSYITANNQGEFHFEAIENRKRGRLYIRSLGYEEAIVEYDVSKSSKVEVRLKAQVIELAEMEIIGQKAIPKILGDSNASRIERLNYFRNPAVMFDLKKEKGQLTKLHFSLSERDGFPEAPLLVNIYIFRLPLVKTKSIEALGLNVINSALKESILLEGGSAGWNVLDLEPYGLTFDESLVLVHFIYPVGDPRFEWKGEQTNLNQTGIYFGPTINTYEDIKTTQLVPMFQVDATRGGFLVVSPVYRTNRYLYIPAVALAYDAIK